MIEIIQSDTFRLWMQSLRDHRARALIAARLLRLARGLLGETESVGDGVHELKIHWGPGYRIYYIRKGLSLIVLLCGGNKKSQDRDIAFAKRLAREWRNHG